MLQDSFLTFSTQQGDTLIKLSEGVNMFASKHGNLIMRSRDHAKHLHDNTENFIRVFNTFCFQIVLGVLFSIARSSKRTVYRS